jgi:hypothetical protein
MSIKGQHFRKGMDVEKYQSNPFWEKENKKKKLTEQKRAAKIPTDKPEETTNESN